MYEFDTILYWFQTMSVMNDIWKEKKPWVEVIIKDIEGSEVTSFYASDDKSFYQMALDHDVELPVSCCSWACFVCACKILEGQELVDVGKISVPLVDIDSDQVLSCVWGVFSQFLNWWTYHRIVLQKLL